MSRLFRVYSKYIYTYTYRGAKKEKEILQRKQEEVACRLQPLPFDGDGTLLPHSSRGWVGASRRSGAL